MIIRSAVLEGTVSEAGRTQFDHHMMTTVRAAIGRYPGIISVTIRRPAEAEPGAPPIYMIFDLRFDSLDAMHAALASEVRQQVGAEIARAMGDFQGRVYHLILEEIT